MQEPRSINPRYHALPTDLRSGCSGFTGSAPKRPAPWCLPGSPSLTNALWKRQRHSGRFSWLPYGLLTESSPDMTVTRRSIGSRSTVTSTCHIDLTNRTRVQMGTHAVLQVIELAMPKAPNTVAVNGIAMQPPAASFARSCWFKRAPFFAFTANDVTAALTNVLILHVKWNNVTKRRL